MANVAKANGNGYQDVAPPVQIEGFWVKEEGAVLEGVVLESGQGQFGTNYKIRVLEKPVKAKTNETDSEGNKTSKTITVAVGKNVGVDGNAHIRAAIDERLRAKVPTMVRIEITGRRGQGWAYKIGVKDPF
jgi:hypothetical protein